MAQRIGIDVGGTNVKIALVSDKGKLFIQILSRRERRWGTNIQLTV